MLSETATLQPASLDWLQSSQKIRGTSTVDFVDLNFHSSAVLFRDDPDPEGDDVPGYLLFNTSHGGKKKLLQSG